MPPNRLDALLLDLRARLEAFYGDRLAAVYLCGSYARGEAGPESDVDVLAVLRGEVRPAAEALRLGALRTALSLEHGVLLSLLAVSEAQFAREPYGLLPSVRAEGVALWARPPSGRGGTSARPRPHAHPATTSRPPRARITPCSS